MRKFLIITIVFFLCSIPAWSAKMPDDVKNYIQQEISGVDIRFDGVIILPTNTIYLPLYPSLFSDVKHLQIKETYPSGKSLKQEPDIIIFNNDFVLMKVLSDGKGHKTVLHQTNPPLQVRTGLLPQDMLVPSGLIIPENIKGIIGNLKIDTKSEDSIKLSLNESNDFLLEKNTHDNPQTLISQLKNKTIYVPTNFSKNLQVLEPGHSTPKYSLAQKSIPVDVKAVNKGKFLLITTYDRPFVDVVSVADSRFIKQIALDAPGEEILIDEENNKAYITAPEDSRIYVIDLTTMSLIQKIRVNGYCEHLTLSEGKMIYVDKKKNEIWAIEINNDYELRDVGIFPNVSAIAFANNKIFLSSRTKSRIAVIDYDSLGLITEFTTVNKPVSMLLNDSILYVLGAQNNDIQYIDTKTNTAIGSIELATGGFSSKIHKISNSDMAVVTDVKNSMYSIIDLSKNKLLSTYYMNIPAKDVVITEKVNLFK